MTITPEQLDELERRAMEVSDARDAGADVDVDGDIDDAQIDAAIRLSDAWSAMHDLLTDDVTLQLVAIARAALAWRDTLGRPRGDREADAAEHGLIVALRGTP